MTDEELLCIHHCLCRSINIKSLSFHLLFIESRASFFGIRLSKYQFNEITFCFALEHFPSTIFPRNRFMNIHSTTILYQGDHLVNFVEQPKEPAGVYKEDLPPFPLLWILSHVVQHPVGSFSAEREDNPTHQK